MNVSNSSVSVLMVDDNEADVEMVRRYLRSDVVPWDISFQSTLRPEEALIQVPEGDFDLLLLDYQFPLGDGFDLASLLSESGDDLPVIMVTGQGSEEIASEAFKRGIDDYLIKDDLTAETLRDSIQQILFEGEETKTNEYEYTEKH